MPVDSRGASFPFSALAGELAEALAQGPDPEGSRAWLTRLMEAAGSLPVPAVHEAAIVGLAAALLSQSPYLSTLLVREPGLLLSLATDPYLRREKPAGILRDALLEATGDAPDAASLARALRRFRQREYVRIGVREIGYGSPVEVGRELSGLADAAFEAAIEWHAKQLSQAGPPLTDAGKRCRFVVFGMGKLGGEELNFSSDVDVIYLYETDAGAAGTRTLHEYFARLCERVTRTIGDVTDDGFVFRVDLRLRPEGSRGAIVNSLESAERYYESFGRPWERQAWLKARPIAGDLELGDEALAVLDPFIYPRTISPTTIEDVRELRRRMTAEARARAAAESLSLPGSHTVAEGPLGAIAGFDVKLGEGGIREAEFFTQALQLVHAGKRPGLRAKGTLRALDQLFFAGLVADREHRALAAAYVFLRKIEHRIQMEGGLHAHRVPEQPEAIELLARRLGFEAGADLAEALGAARAEVRVCYATLGEASDDRVPPEVYQLLDPKRVGEELHQPLTQLGFRDVAAAAFELDLLRTKPYSPLGPSASGPAARLAPELLAEIAASPDPDLALRHTVDLVGRRGASALIWRLLDESRPALRLVASLFGTSDYLSKLFLAHPELLDQLLLAGRAEPRRPPEAVRAEAAARAAVASNFEDAANALRRFKHEEVLRIGLNDVAGALETEEVLVQLSNLADALVAETLALVTRELGTRGVPVVPIAVIGLGKLGARELGYASDLDVIFVFDAPEADLEAGPRATRVAQRLIGALGAHMEEGRLYEVDTRLRPSGRMGTLVSSLDALRAYHAKDAQLWERQALIKTRAVAGDPALGTAVEALAHDVVYQGAGVTRGAADTAAEIARLRARMEREIAQEHGGRVNLKAGRGGLVDIEFIAQLLQLVHGPSQPALQVRTAREALAAARDRGLVSPDDYVVLDDGYRFLRRLEARVRMVHDRSLSDIDLDDPVEMEKLARRMGVLPKGADSAGKTLRELYEMHVGRVRSVYDRWFPRA